MSSTPIHAPANRLGRVLLAYAFLDEFVLLYPLYTLLFARTGLTTAQISSLLVIWSLTSVVLEVPSGALADLTSRKALLAVAPLAGAAGFALWVLVPSYPAFAAGFVLWGVKGALVSGALEALVYEELDRRDRAGSFAAVLGRAHAAGTAGVVAATALAAPVVARWGYTGVGAASVAAGVAGCLVGLALPEHRAGSRERTGEPGYVATLAAGLGEARRDVRVRRLVVLVAGIAAVWGALEEYTPLVAVAAGAPVAAVPWWEVVLWSGAAAGSLVAGRLAGISPRALAVGLVLAALVLGAGAGSGRVGGLVLVALAFGAFQAADVVVATWLQDAVSGRARATVTSVAALAAELVAVLVYALDGVLAGRLGDGVAMAVLAGLYLPVAVVAWRAPSETSVAATAEAERMAT